jgi:hypothetical protein
MNEDFAVLLFCFGISLTANVALLVGLLRSSLRARRWEKAELPAPRSDDEHVERLERAVDALTSQVDQIASGQEFLSRLVAERLDKLARLPAAPQADAPPR